MASEAQRLEREILHTRERLGEDVDALVERVDPRRVAAREASRVRETVKAHPGAAALVALGVTGLVAVWLVRRRR
jgi:hypothetical protein